MLKRMAMLLAAVFALGAVFGSTTGASAHGKAYGCCGPIKPTYVYSDVYKHVTKYRHRDVHYTTRFPQYHHIYYVKHVHVVTNIHTITHVHHHRVGYIVNLPSHKIVMSFKTIHTGSSYTTTDCRCARGSSHCK